MVKMSSLLLFLTIPGDLIGHLRQHSLLLFRDRCLSKTMTGHQFYRICVDILTLDLDPLLMSFVHLNLKRVNPSYLRPFHIRPALPTVIRCTLSPLRQETL